MLTIFGRQHPVYSWPVLIIPIAIHIMVYVLVMRWPYKQDGVIHIANLTSKVKSSVKVYYGTLLTDVLWP